MIIKCNYEDIIEDVNGGCIACGEIIYGGVEPDARKYECEFCGQHEVYGLAELAIMDKLEIIDDE